MLRGVGVNVFVCVEEEEEVGSMWCEGAHDDTFAANIAWEFPVSHRQLARTSFLMLDAPFVDFTFRHPMLA